jgi:hypothetical protein
VHGPTLSIIWVLSLVLFAMRQIRFWAKRRPLAIWVAAWLLYVALVYLPPCPSRRAPPGAVKRRQARYKRGVGDRMGAGTLIRPGPRTCATPAAKFRRFETR